MGLDDDVSDDETSDEARDADEVAMLERRALAVEEAADVQALLDGIRRLPPDSKVQELKGVIRELRGDGFAQAMVFTQYTDTMDFLREELIRWEVAQRRRWAARAPEARAQGVHPVDRRDGALRLMCFSGRGGEIRSAGGEWSAIGRDEVKRRFREGEADLLLCTDAAAEGLNFQFCGALINYDMPWNPMRVEQRIGRIDRLGPGRIRRSASSTCTTRGPSRPTSTARYGPRINLFEAVVGPLQPILAQLPRTIAGAVLTGRRRRAEGRRATDRAAGVCGGTPEPAPMWSRPSSARFARRGPADSTSTRRSTRTSPCRPERRRRWRWRISTG